jgi:hypothetical protein
MNYNLRKKKQQTFPVHGAECLPEWLNFTVFPPSQHLPLQKDTGPTKEHLKLQTFSPKFLHLPHRSPRLQISLKLGHFFTWWSSNEVIKPEHIKL